MLTIRRVRAGNLFTIILATWALITIGRFGVNIWHTYGLRGSAATTHVSNWRNLIVGRKPSLGSPVAPVVIIEFADYQCPFCRTMEPRLQTLVSSHPERVAVYRYNLPIVEIHPYAESAAIAATCATLQNVTESFQAQLFSHQSSFAEIRWADLAQQSGVINMNAFSECMNDKSSSESVARDVAAGSKLNLTGTPSFIINGNLVKGAISASQLNSLYLEASKSFQ